MKTLIFTLLLTLHNSHAQEKPISNYGEIYANIDLGTKIDTGVVDKNGRIYIHTFEASFLVLNPEGKVEKAIKLKAIPNREQKLLPLNNGEFFYAHSGNPNGKTGQTLEILDQNGNVRKSVANYPLTFPTYPIQLKNGNIAYGMTDTLYIFTPDLQEVVRFKANHDLCFKIVETEDGSILFYDKIWLYIMDPSHKVRSVQVGIEKQPIALELVRKDGSIVMTRHDDQFFIFDKLGKQLVNANQPASGFIELPDGTLVGRSTTDMDYLDGEGKLKIRYFHDSKHATTPFYAGKNVIAYLNSSELVFINNKGEEIGLHKITRNPYSSEKFVNLGSNRFAFFESLGSKVIFVRH